MESVDKKDIARLIVEELMNEDETNLSFLSDVINNITDDASYEEAKQNVEQTKAIKNITEEEYRKLIDLLNRKKKELEANAQPESSTEEDEAKQSDVTQQQPKPEDADEQSAQPQATDKPYPLDDTTKKEFIIIVKEFQEEFYNKGYKVEQGKIVNALIEVLAKIAGDGGLELSYVDPVKQTNLQEQEGDVELDESEVKNLRISFRAFLSLVNKTKKALVQFEDSAAEGSVLTTGLKRDFLELLTRLQNSITLLVKSISKITGSQQLQERTKEEIAQQWRVVKASYVKTLEAVSGVKELLAGTGGEGIDAKAALQDAYSAALDLSQYFPSVNPFGKKGTTSKSDLTRYKGEFDAAIAGVKESLQYVVNVARRGAADSSALADSKEALKLFSKRIKDIFGVEGQVSGEIESPEAPAVTQEPQQGQQPEDETTTS